MVVVHEMHDHHGSQIHVIGHVIFELYEKCGHVASAFAVKRERLDRHRFVNHRLLLIHELAEETIVLYPEVWRHNLTEMHPLELGLIHAEKSRKVGAEFRDEEFRLDDVGENCDVVLREQV